jgi:hypothetical protein
MIKRDWLLEEEIKNVVVATSNFSPDYPGAIHGRGLLDSRGKQLLFEISRHAGIVTGCCRIAGDILNIYIDRYFVDTFWEKGMILSFESSAA